MAKRSKKPHVEYRDKTGDKVILRPKTYAELKKNMRSYLEDCINNEIFVFRYRRGEWGEWYEYWAKVNGKPIIYKQGWS